MKKITLVFAVVLAAMGSAYAQCDPPPSGIVAWWPGQNNANDIIGSNNGTLMNGTGFTTGEVGTAFSFNGANNFVLVGASPSLSVGLQSGFTYEAWIKPATVSVVKTLFEYERALATYNGSDVGMLFGIHNTLLDGTPGPCLYANIADTSNQSHEIVSPTNLLAAGVWQHIALSYDPASGQAAIYINGVAVTRTNLGSFTPQSSFTNLCLGARTTYNSVANPGDAYYGSMDEISFYNRALSSNEIAAIYNAGSAGKCTSASIAPFITHQPTNLTEVVSNAASFSVTATGTTPLTYQWNFDHTNLLGATNATLTLPNVQLAQAGNYSVLVSNVVGFTNSAVAVLTVTTPPPPPPPPSCDPPPAGIVAWWPGQDNANDIIGGNNGTLINGTGFTTGEVGTAFNFNGVNNFVLVNPVTSSSLDVGQGAGLTFEGWINPATINQQQIIAEYERILGSGNGADVGMDIVIQSGGYFYANLADTSNQSHEISAPANSLVAGVWQHVALTYDKASGLATLYINGAAAAQVTLGNFTPQTSFTNLLLGARTYLGSVSGPNTLFDGAMDEFTVYNRALASTEVAAIYQAGSAGKCTPAAIAPIITQQPTNLTVVVSNAASFSVAATGTVPLRYQWSFDHTNLLGATNSILVLPNVQLAQAGNYSVLVSNVAGFTNSAIAVLTVTTPPPPPPPSSCDPPPAGIVAWWPGQNNANDIIGGNNGTLINGTSFTTGEVGTAFNFNGVNNFVLVGATPSLSVGLQSGFTYEAWINPATVSVVKTLFEYERAMATYNGSDVGMLFGIHNTLLDGTPGPCLYANVGDTDSMSHELVSPTNLLTAGVWQHVALTYDRASGQAAIYINGVAVTQTNLGTFTPQSSFTNLCIGARTTYNSVANPGDAYYGSMDEISFYNRALSSNEIAAIYNAGSAGKCTPAPMAPYITQQPTNLTVVVSNAASFSVAATGTVPLRYQWSFDHTNLLGATNAVLVLPNVQLAQAGNYSVLVSNVVGFTNSAVAVLTVTTPPPPPPPPSCDAPPAGIVAWWPGQNNANDIIGGNNGTLINDTSFTTGEVGTAFNFNGVNNFVLVGATPSLSVGLQNGFTYEAWINPVTVSSVMELFEYERALGTDNGSDVGVLFGIHNTLLDGTPGPCLYANIADTSNLSHELVSPANLLTVGAWQHIALSYDAASGLAAIYINGVAVTQTNLGTFIPQSSFTNLLLGARTTYGSVANPPNAYDGSMDEVSFYDRALSSNEIAAIYQAGSAGKCTPAPMAPYITQQPTNLTVVVSNAASFSVAATGTAPLMYQWSFDHTNLLGATNAVLVLPNVQVAQAGNYSVLVSNLAGFTNSAIAVLTVTTPPPPPPPPSCDAPPAGIVAWWPGQNNANDIIGGNNGTLINDTSFTTGEVGTAFNFNGVNNFVLVGATPSLSVGLQNGFTYEAWINPVTVSSVMELFEYERALGTDNGSDVGVLFGIHNTLLDGTPGPCLYANIADTSNLSHELVSPANLLTVGAWQHIALSYDAASGLAAIYINGVAVTQTNLGTFIPQSSFTNLLLGARTTYGSVANPPNAYDGSMDEVSFYDRALSSNEIAAIYQAGSAGKCTPAPMAPYITQQPTNLTVVVSNAASFSVAATGTAPLMYQWSFDHTNLLGATNAVLVLPNVQVAQAGNYSVQVSNVVGFTNSAIAVLTVTTPPPPPPPPSCDAPPAGIVAWWPGQDNANDIIGGNNGTLINGTSFTTGEVGTAFNFNGVNNFILVGASSSLSVGLQNGFTYEAWIEPATVSVVKTLFEYERALATYNGSDVGMLFGIHNTQLDGTFGPCLYANLGDTNSGSHELVTPSNSIMAGQWQHVAVTYDKASGVAAIYINGVSMIRTNLGSFTLQSSFTNVLLGARTTYNSIASPGDAFYGSMDEVSFYNRALSSNEVAAIYQAGSAGKCTPVAIAPIITQQPTNLTVVVSNTANFSVTATGTAPLTYQWSFSNTNLVGATNTTLVLPNVQFAQAGNYSVLVSNVAGFTNSAVAVLTVQSPPPPPPPPSCDPPPAGIVAWWPGQFNASDIIGGNNGNLMNGIGFTTNGEVGSAFSFNEGNNYVLINPATPSNLDVGQGAGLTFEGWIKPATVTKQQMISQYERVLGSGNGADEGMNIVIQSSAYLYANVADTSNQSHEISTPASSLVAGVWQHIALTYDKASGFATLYINGVASAQMNFGSFTPQTGYTNLLLGARTYLGSASSPNTAYSGAMDEFSVYSRALSSNEIAAIYQAGSAGKCYTPTPETVFSLAPTNVMSGSTIAVTVLMNATGLENTFLASVGYDPTKLVLQNVQLGQATAGAYLQEVDLKTNAGLVGFAILLNSGSTMPAGTNEQVALVNFQALPVTSNTTVSLFFTNSPTLQQTYDNNFNLLPTLYTGAAVTLLPAEYEADVYPRTNGDHTVTVQDWLEEGRMVAGLDTPANSDEFHRADCAPRGAPDGVLTVADWVQAGRYALGLDPLTVVTLPPVPLLGSQPHGSPAPTRTLQVGTVSVQRGQTVSVPVVLICTTNENAVGLTISYNPSQLQVTGVALGSAMADGRTNINYNQPGKLGIVLALPPGASLPPGTNQLLVLQVTASTNASGVAALTLDNSLVQLQVADQTANALAANYVSGSVTLPPQPTVATAIAGKGLQLSWPITNGTFQVQSADTPAGPWTDAPFSVITNGANATVTVTVTNQQQYYRLVGQ